MRRPLLNHLERKAPRKRSSGDPRLLRAVTAHVESRIGRVDLVLHDLLSDVVHVDLLWVQPGRHGNFHTFVTCGMSERPMTTPHGAGGCRYAELLLRLPPTWNLDPASLSEQRHNWPLQELEHLARLPHLYATWLWSGHAVSNGDPPEPLYDTTDFCGVVIAPPIWTSPDFFHLNVNPGRAVHFFSVIPLYADELKLTRVMEPGLVLDWLEQAGVTDCVDPGRPRLGGQAN